MSPLFLLIWLQMIGWFRLVGRSFKTIKGALLAIFSLLIVGGYLAQFLFVNRAVAATVNPEAILTFGPTFLLGYCLLNALLSSGEHAVIFSLAEISFLFPAPFSRRQLLSFKIFSLLLSLIPTSVFFLFLVQIHARWLPAAFLGLLFLMMFVQLFGMVVQQIAVSVGVRFYTRTRRSLLILGLVAVVVGFYFQGPELFTERFQERFVDLQRSSEWQTATTPFRWFFQLFLVDKGDFGSLALHAALCASILLVCLVTIFWLDADYFEATAANSVRIHAALQRLRGKIQADDTPGKKKDKQASFGLPMFPWMGGTGPMVWRHLSDALRDWVKSFVVLVFLAAFLVGPIMAAFLQRESREIVPVLGGLVLGMSFIISTMIPFDFRGDIDRMSYLKTLPLSAWRLSLGQILTPVLLLTIIQSAILLACQFTLPNPGSTLFLFMLFTLPVNLLFLALENMLFLIFPSRLISGNPADIQAAGRNVFFMLVKMLFMFIIGALGICSMLIVNMGVSLLRGTEWSFPQVFFMKPGLLAAWVILALSGAALVPLIAVLFDRFDVGRDTPA